MGLQPAESGSSSPEHDHPNGSMVYRVVIYHVYASISLRPITLSSQFDICLSLGLNSGKPKRGKSSGEDKVKTSDVHGHFTRIVRYGRGDHVFLPMYSICSLQESPLPDLG